jgi:hypothetical protein
MVFGIDQLLPSYARGMIDGERTPGCSSEGKRARQAEYFRARSSAVIGERNREEFELLGYHDVSMQHEAWDEEKHRRAQQWLKEQQASLEREIGRQHLAVAREANEVARSASYAASDAAAAARSQARTARAALAIATIALLVSIITPEKITDYLSSKPWASWISQ